MVDYLENKLKGNINYQKIPRIFGTNLYIAEQLLKLLTGIIIKEYIRYRRLTLATKDLRDKKEVKDTPHTTDKIKGIYLTCLNYRLKDCYYIEWYSKNNIEI